MNVPNIEGLGKLHQAITEALEIEKCSICLEQLESTVLLWPCTHWFCNKCISTLQKSARGEKVTCPLCKVVTSRRKILPFQDKQSEYEDHLQTLIGALSLDLKFDVTSYNNLRKQTQLIEYDILKTNEEVESMALLSPVKKTRTKASVRVIEVKTKTDEIQTRPTRRSGYLNAKNRNSLAVKNKQTPAGKSPIPSTALLPETPNSPKEKKVREWLDANKFSQAGPDVCVETVVADVHNAELDESLCFSETALQSVSQVDSGSVQSPVGSIQKKNHFSALSSDDIKVVNISANKFLTTKDNVKRKKKSVCMPSVEKFDELFSENRKMQAVKTTYGSKNPYSSVRNRGQRFAVKTDLFTSIDENKDVEKSSSEEIKTTEDTLEDFSSGSGEEWTVEKKPRKSNILSKGKNLQNSLKKKALRGVKNTVEMYVKTQRKSFKDSVKKGIKEQKIKRNNTYQESNNKEEKIQNQMLFKRGIVEPKENLAKEIIDDWNDTKDSNSLFLENGQLLTKDNVDIAMGESKTSKSSETKSVGKISESKELNSKDNSAVNRVMETPSKEVNARSPGWSRLKSTKKEFHLSDKKKLSLSKSSSSLANLGISPLLNQSKSSVSSLNKVSPEGTINKSSKSVGPYKTICPSKPIDDARYTTSDVDCETKTEKTTEIRKSLNASLNSSASGSPFRGFSSPEEKVPFKGSKAGLNLASDAQKSNNTDVLRLLSKKRENNVAVSNKNKELSLSESLRKGDCMEVDLIAHEDPEFPQKTNIEKFFSREISEESTKPLEKFNTEGKCVSALPQQSSVFPKKRDRDSGIHNESGISSPVRKKVCRDAEVQTSPGRMQSVIRDMLKDMCGIELEDMIKRSNKCASLKPVDIGVTSPIQHFTSSQDSDKENVDIISNNFSASKKNLDESDIVFATEESSGLTQLNQLGSARKNALVNNQDSSNLNVLKEFKEFIYDVDPDAPTQLYKTPVVPKKPLQTSTKEYTIVSNPSSSELKRTDHLFNKSDVIFPDETPKGVTPWNYSGVDELNGNTGTVKKWANESVPPASQSSKEKTRSRRQLDFVEENSNDIFDFEKQTSSHNKDGAENCQLDCSQNERVEILRDKSDELDDIFMQSDELPDVIVNSQGKEREVSFDNEHHKEMNRSEIVTDNMTDTSGIVGPSELQADDNQLNFCNKQNNTDTSKKIVSNNPDKVLLGRINKSTQLENEVRTDILDSEQDSYMFHQSPKRKTRTGCVKKRDDDEESNPASDVSYVEGTPDVSQNEVNQQEMQNNEHDLETCNQPQKLVDKEDFPQRVRENKLSHKEHIHHESQQKEEDGVKSGSNNINENTEVEDESLCFASSLLNAQQNQVLACVLGAMGLTYSKNVGPHISHLIVGTKDGCFQNTYKVLLAMALHKPIIRFEWVEQVIRTGGSVPLDTFVALDPSGECGVLRAKADKNRQLLQDFAIHIYNVNDRIVLKEQIEELVKLCGGSVVKDLHDFYTVPRDKFRIIVLSEPPDSLTQGDWRQRYSAVEVMIDWVYNTIGRYRVMPLVPYMVTEATDAVPFLQHEGYPKELIFDLSMQE
ncbi:uncharacterized protein LOC128985481 [Macrosteles quadrilineatus]|uniref:uncharacterized protein LOC128985481 n=1 Tax=Macrosteles quadrilineatus TaxID=74068 RepID=UPI0023E23428|nr:uncharacterized protein LOC128985481 [Macrosteles quadrilineatus]